MTNVYEKAYKVITHSHTIITTVYTYEGATNAEMIELFHIAGIDNVISWIEL